jgi:hypothetical protein
MALFCALSSISRHPGDSTGMYALSIGRLLFHPGKRLSGGARGSTLQALLLLGLSVEVALDYHCPSSTDKISRPFFTFNRKCEICLACPMCNGSTQWITDPRITSSTWFGFQIGKSIGFAADSVTDVLMSPGMARGTFQMEKADIMKVNMMTLTSRCPGLGTASYQNHLLMPTRNGSNRADRRPFIATNCAMLLALRFGCDALCQSIGNMMERSQDPNLDSQLDIYDGIRKLILMELERRDPDLGSNRPERAEKAALAYDLKHWPNDLKQDSETTSA